jgi:catechol 2,3-dioxygenase-like lactoylglutathione lyase family enzyme
MFSEPGEFLTMTQPLEILETALYAPDLAAAERFYVDVLGLTPMSKKEGRHLFFRCGHRMLLLFNPEFTATQQSVFPDAAPNHGARGPGHMAFFAPMSELDAWRERLEARGVAIESDATWSNGARSLYFRDPAGNSIEIASSKLWGIPEEGIR